MLQTIGWKKNDTFSDLFSVFILFKNSSIFLHKFFYWQAYEMFLPAKLWGGSKFLKFYIKPLFSKIFLRRLNSNKS
jgi:hypothetical protein